MTKPSGCSSAFDAERAEACDERGDAVAFLDAQLGGAAHGDVAAVRGQRRNGRQFVDEAGNFLRRDVDGAGLRSPRR